MSRRRTSRSRTAPLVFFALLQSSGSALAGDPPPKDDEAALAPARALFAEALHDEEEGRAAVALEKFRRVRDVRDTAAVEYRIASCEEGLGHLVAAAASYESAIRLGGDDSITVTAGARDRLASVQKRIGHLTLATSSPAPAGQEVFIDGAVPAALTEIPLDPGPHLVTARAPGAASFRSEVTVLEGARLSVSVPLLPSPPPEPPRGHGGRTAGWACVAGGAALLAGSGIVLLLRQSDIGSLDQECKSGTCPPGANRSSLEATRSRALVEGPLAVGLAVAGALAGGAGVFLLLRSSSPSPAPVTGVGVGPAGAFLGGVF
jgi:hypothetical protein